MKKIPLFLAIIFLLASCSENKMPLQEDIFTKKKDCAVFKEQEELKKSRSILDLFYSPWENSCIIAEEIDIDDENFQIKISDYLTNRSIYEAYFQWDFARCNWSEDIENKTDSEYKDDWTLKYSNKYIYCMNRVTVKLDELKQE